MSNSSSLSAAKRRRGGGPPVGQPLTGAPPGIQGPPQMGGGGGVGGGGGGLLPPGLPPNFRQMPPQLQQQILRQIQQRMMQAQQQHQAQQQAQAQAQAQQQHPQQHPVDTRQNIPIVMSSNNMNEKMPSKIAGNGPYVVNSVLHNRAISEVDGIHIRDLPMSSAGLPCLPSGAALPPNILFKLHHDELLNQDATINEYSNLLQMLTNRVDKIERGGGASAPSSSSNSVSQENTSTDMNSLAGNTDFIAKVLDNILTNTNLSDIINQIEPLQKENESLRALIHSQQATLNELSTLVMKLINGSLPLQNQHQHQHQHQDQHQEQREPELNTINLNTLNANYEDTQDEFCNYVNGAGGEMGERIYQQNQDEVIQGQEGQDDGQEGQDDKQEEQEEQEEQDDGQEEQEEQDDGQEEQEEQDDGQEV